MADSKSIELAVLNSPSNDKGENSYPVVNNNMETKEFAPPSQEFAPPDGGSAYTNSSQGFAPPSQGGGGYGKPRGQSGGQDMLLSQELKECLDVTATLEVPKNLIAKFETIDHKEVEHRNDRFNDLDQQLERQNEMKVTSMDDLVKKINTYQQEADPIGRIIGTTCCLISCGLYWLCSRKTIKDGHFGHYRSSGRDMIHHSGIQTLWSWYESWKQDILINSDEYVRQLGSKFLLTVPENYIGGASQKAAETYVLFKQGRYVLEDADYQHIEVKYLSRNDNSFTTEIGPLKIIYVKEGYLGGANQIYKGMYEILPPGPPYILHTKDYEMIEVVQRKLDWFQLGPMRYITVREGYLAGVYHKRTGNYQILPPGNTYALNDKDYDLENAPDIIERKENFKHRNQRNKDPAGFTPGFELGPYTFITVKKGYIAGAYKVQGGDFIVLPPGHTYQLHKANWRDPKMARQDRHIVRCGPLTFVTVKPGMITGAYRIKDGKFIEFDDPTKEYRLHEKHYHNLVTIPQYSFEEQAFGPYVTITIRDGDVGVMSKEGKIEIVKPGYYKKLSEFQILPSIPVKVFTIDVPGNNQNYMPCEFKSKDGVDMAITANMSWQVTDPKQTSLYPKPFNELQDDITRRFIANLQKFAKRYNRDELLPTTQNLEQRAGGKKFGADLDKLLQKSLEAIGERFKAISKSTDEAMKEAAQSSNWGVTVIKTNVETFQLEDQRIVADIDVMSRSAIDTSLQTYEGELTVFRQNTEKNTSMKEERTLASIKNIQTKSSNDVKKTKADGDAAVNKINAESLSKIDVLKQQARSTIDVLKSTTLADADAQERKIKLTIRNKERLETARVNANAMKLISAAEYLKQTKENEALSKMTEKQFKLQMADRSVKAMEQMGSASWKMPDQILQFYESFSPYLRMGSVPASDLLRTATGR